MSLRFDHAASRQLMVDSQLRRRGVRDEAVLRAMGEAPREAFVSAELEEFAYADSALPIASGQTISQPFVVAAMIEAAQIGSADRVLEVGAGSGYAAAVLSRIAAQVYAVERFAELVASAAARLGALGYANVEFCVGDGTLGWLERAPFDAIIASAGAPFVPPALKRQLKIGGRLIIPIGDPTSDQRLVRVRRVGAADYEENDLGGVAFVPLVGAQGWNEGADDSE